VISLAFLAYTRRLDREACDRPLASSADRFAPRRADGRPEIVGPSTPGRDMKAQLSAPCGVAGFRGDKDRAERHIETGTYSDNPSILEEATSFIGNLIARLSEPLDSPSILPKPELAEVEFDAAAFIEYLDEFDEPYEDDEEISFFDHLIRPGFGGGLPTMPFVRCLSRNLANAARASPRAEGRCTSAERIRY
jgi:hypothetical protein